MAITVLNQEEQRRKNLETFLGGLASSSQMGQQNAQAEQLRSQTGLNNQVAQILQGLFPNRIPSQQPPSQPMMRSGFPPQGIVPQIGPQGIGVPPGQENYLTPSALQQLQQGGSILNPPRPPQFDITKIDAGPLTIENVASDINKKQTENLLRRPLNEQQFKDFKDIQQTALQLNSIFDTVTSNESIRKNLGPWKIQSLNVPVISNIAAQYADKPGEFAAFKGEVGKFFQQYRKVITGAQASFPELMALQALLPQTSDRPEVFVSKIKASRKTLDLILQAFQTSLDSGGFQAASPLRLPDGLRIKMFDVLKEFGNEQKIFNKPPSWVPNDFDYDAAKKAGYSDEEIKKHIGVK